MVWKHRNVRRFVFVAKSGNIPAKELHFQFSVSRVFRGIHGSSVVRKLCGEPRFSSQHPCSLLLKPTSSRHFFICPPSARPEEMLQLDSIISLVICLRWDLRLGQPSQLHRGVEDDDHQQLRSGFRADVESTRTCERFKDCKLAAGEVAG